MWYLKICTKILNKIQILVVLILTKVYNFFLKSEKMYSENFSWSPPLILLEDRGF